MITIKDIYGKELLTLDVNSLSEADLSGANLRGAYMSGADLSGADLSGADLSGADLSGANLSGANLSGANLSEADLRGADMIIITWHPLNVYITTEHIRIGCQSHSLESWKNFSDEEISGMHKNASEFWKLNKELIIGLCERFVVKEQ